MKLTSSDCVSLKDGDTVYLSRAGIPVRKVMLLKDCLVITGSPDPEREGIFAVRANAVRARLNYLRSLLAHTQTEIASLEKEHHAKGSP